MHRDGSFDRHATADLLVVAVTLAAPVLAAGGAAWPKAVLLLGASGVLWLSPLVRRNSLGVDLAFLGFVLCGGLGFLPLAAFVQFPWWNDLRALGVGLPGTISAQPWLTLQAAGDLVNGRNTSVDVPLTFVPPPRVLCVGADGGGPGGDGGGSVGAGNAGLGICGPCVW